MQAAMFMAGLVALVAGAELLVRGASRLALALGISPLVVGLTVVAFGTSAPEMAVSVGAALDGRTDMALGNVVGSNIAHVLLILGLSALIVPLAVHRQVIRQEVPVMLAATFVLLGWRSWAAFRGGRACCWWGCWWPTRRFWCGSRAAAGGWPPRRWKRTMPPTNCRRR